MPRLSCLLAGLFVGVVAVAGVSACGPRTASPDGTPRRAPNDPTSYAEPDLVVVKHLSLSLHVDFAARTLSGAAVLDLDWRDPTAGTLVLDTRQLEIRKVMAGDGATWHEVPYALAPPDPLYGEKLTLQLRAGAAAASAAPSKVRIEYSTRPEASGLQWLPPELTGTKKAPLMFSQSQAIHARSWVPLQDTPRVRFTYDATLTTPPELVALMSAHNDPDVIRDGSYRFDMPQAIPSYLMAIAVGDLVFRPVSPRSGVWAEPSIIEAAVHEFADTEKMIATAEKLYGPYRWGRYDLLILPPSFPFGGMENPRLSFITPTVIVGDRSLVALVAHELAHSWSGNLVTNSTWSDGWLNEGFTTYVQGRIIEELYGRDVADMDTVIGQRELRDEMATMAPREQVLALPPIVGQDPDQALSGVAYNKGQWFLAFLEERFGRAAFDAFLRHWFDAHAFSAVETSTFARFLARELVARHPGKVTTAELRTWLYEPGIPPFAVPARSARFDAVDEAARQWVAGSRQASNLGTSTWTTNQWAHFLLQLPKVLPAARLAELDAALHLTGTRNPEIAERWYPLAERGGHLAARPAMRQFLIAMGRRKLIKPIYEALAQTADGLAFARDAFAQARGGYHPITTAMVEGILARSEAAPASPAAPAAK